MGAGRCTGRRRQTPPKASGCRWAPGHQPGLKHGEDLGSRPPASHSPAQAVDLGPVHRGAGVSQRPRDPTHGKHSEETLRLPVETLVLVTTAVDSSQLFTDEEDGAH